MAELGQPLKRRRFNDVASVRPKMEDFHCFEVTAVYDLALDLAKRMAQSEVPDLAAFLPAPRTWLEFADETGRVGLFLEKRSAGKQCHITVCARNDGSFGSRSAIMLNLYGERQTVLISNDTPQVTPVFGMIIFAFLAMINSPRVIGRKQHAPHAGLERNTSGGSSGS
jgi:hypothetical protein